ncbi:MAG TPA: glycosyltransferase family 2 protein, partial [Gammaproteobacteria bacterium]|nr:glycosyltransferase family 2 protein [Gammaproteobacteria bacterium]
MFILLFWASVLFILYTYFGYPVLIRQKANKKQKHTSVPAYTEVPDEEWPTVSIVVPVHNEAHHVERKINNLREIDYPKDKLTITFVSDGSEDGTN